jgi:pimeloyl-ACP methyl ester carboxylesterase
MKPQWNKDRNHCSAPDCTRELVVLVHGIWMTGLELGLLAWRLRQNGFATRRFFYPSRRSTPAENAERLYRFLLEQRTETIHLVAHSLGGIVLLHLFDRYTDLPPGRLVIMGSPVQGSGVAQQMDSNPLTSVLLGNSREQGLLGGAPDWKGGRDLGVISGTKGIGIGTLIGGLSGPSDGAVAIAETEVAAAVDHCLIPVSHMGMVISRAVAMEVVTFLQIGRFSGEHTAAGTKNGPKICPDIPLE